LIGRVVGVVALRAEGEGEATGKIIHGTSLQPARRRLTIIILARRSASRSPRMRDRSERMSLNAATSSSTLLNSLPIT